MEPSDDFPAFPFGGICDRSLEGPTFTQLVCCVFFEVEVHEGGGSMVKTREPTGKPSTAFAKDPEAKGKDQHETE